MTSQKWGAMRLGDGWRITTWAPSATSVELALGVEHRPMEKSIDGFWAATIGVDEGAPYKIVVDKIAMPDPASRLQDTDVHSASVLFDTNAYRWKDDWRGRNWSEAVLYELHIGTFTAEGTFAAAMDRLPGIAKLGFTAIEIMPIGQWSGDRGWGYDGVLPFAPHPAYGTPGDFRSLVEAAQGLGLMVILDVVMNHFGPDGAYIHQVAPEFFDQSRSTPWGAAIDFSQPAVRQFWIECALMWIIDYRVDGLRLDAVHQIAGDGSVEFFRELDVAIGTLDLGRKIHLILEDERNEPDLRESHSFNANWNDDFHHAVHTALTGESHSYYENFAHDPIADLVLALSRGHIEEGQERIGDGEPRGAPSGHLPTTAFVNSTQTHDQIGNRPNGERLLSLTDTRGALVAYSLLLVAPYVPMVFMGEERGETAPFQFFADYQGHLAEAVRNGRASEFDQISEMGDGVPDPLAHETFERSKLTWDDSEHAREWLDTTRGALHFRSQYLFGVLESGRGRQARVERVGPHSVCATWNFERGRLTIALNLGSVAFDAELSGSQFAVGNIVRDAYAVAARMTAP